MYTKLEISHFRAFKSLTIEPLKRLNLIAGDNNIGKTGVLEAIFLAHANSLDRLEKLPGLFRRSQVREHTGERLQDVSDNFWLWLFHKRQLDLPWSLSLSDTSQMLPSMRGEIMTHGPGGLHPYQNGDPSAAAILRIKQTYPRGDISKAFFTLHGGLATHSGNLAGPQNEITTISTRFDPPSNDAELVNTISVRNEEEELIEYLRLVEPRLRKLKYLKLPNHVFPYVYADIGFGRGKDLIPATQLGQGFARLLSLFATAMVNRPKILLIDEFENGLQHDALDKIWSALGQLARNRDIQVFATTHSYECIEAAHDVASKAPEYDLGLIRLQWSRDEEVEALMLDREMIETALDSRLEVR
jgi:hypothetical protein